MIKKNEEGYIVLQKKLRKLENDYSSTKERLKMYGPKDCSENSDWLLLNENLLNYQTQITSLKAKMVAISQEDDKIITYRLLENGEEKTIQLTNGESNPDQGKISRVSPLGIALGEQNVGEIVEVKASQKKYQIKIISIK